MTLAEKQVELTTRLAALLIAQAKKIPPRPTEFHADENLIPGCLARLWFTAQFRDGLCCFDCDSDSLVVKAIAGLLCDFYSGHAPAEIMAHDPGFLAPLGITQHLTPNRRNALSKIWERIRQFAEANPK
ncbi:MAG TPA: SufE family protein [Candidatus Limnocylindrales bacterium]|nr:SufE family protein [Candidatus Limnocylindrales bacterium]